MLEAFDKMIYTCLNCGATSTPENRLQFITEYECWHCRGKVKGEAEGKAKAEWREKYKSLGLPTA